MTTAHSSSNAHIDTCEGVVYTDARTSSGDLSGDFLRIRTGIISYHASHTAPGW